MYVLIWKTNTFRQSKATDPYNQKNVGAQILKVNKRIDNSLPHISSKFKIKALVSTSFIGVFLQNVFSFPPASKPVIYSIITEIGHKF